MTTSSTSKSNLRKRMEALNRRPLEHPPDESETVRNDRSPKRKPRRRPRLEIRDDNALESLVPGSEIRTDDGETAYLVTMRVSAIDEGFRDLAANLRTQFQSPESPVARQFNRVAKGADVRGRDVVFMDIETTGLSGTPLFLIGVMGWEEDELVVRQYFARDFGEERATLALYAQRLKRDAWLVTFNGASFDAPFIRKRADIHGVSIPSGLPHLDLLRLSRRVWGKQMPNCRLITMEKRVCGRERYDDIPSSEIPAAYREFVRTGDASEVASILTHNALDLVTMADLMTRLPDHHVTPKRLYRRRGVRLT